MFIGCDDSTGYSDYYWIDNINSLEELQNYIQNKLPIMGSKVSSRFRRSIVSKDDTYSTLIYLNNYNNIFTASLYFMNDEDIDRLIKERCNSCKNYNYTFGCFSRFRPQEEIQCSNYTEEIYFSIWSSIKNKLKKVK